MAVRRGESGFPRSGAGEGAGMEGSGAGEGAGMEGSGAGNQVQGA